MANEKIFRLPSNFCSLIEDFVHSVYVSFKEIWWQNRFFINFYFYYHFSSFFFSLLLLNVILSPKKTRSQQPFMLEQRQFWNRWSILNNLMLPDFLFFNFFFFWKMKNVLFSGILEVLKKKQTSQKKNKTIIKNCGTLSS